MFNALQNNTGQLTPFAGGPASQKHVQAWRNGNRQLHLIFPGARLDHVVRLELLHGISQVSLEQLCGVLMTIEQHLCDCLPRTRLALHHNGTLVA